MLTQPLSGGDDRTRGMIGVSSPTAFPLAIVGDDVTAGQTGVSSSLSTPPHPCAFSSPSSVTPPNSHTPVPLSIHINPPPPPFSVSLSTPPFMLTHSASSLPPISSPPLPPPHSPFFSIFLNPSLLPPPSLSLPPFSPPPLPSTTSHSSSSSSSISILPSPSISPPTLSHFSTPSSSCHLLPSFIHPSPSYLCSSVSSFSLPSFSSPAPPSPHLSVICSPSPSPSVSTTLHPSSPPPPPPPPSCCPCSSLLPRLLSTHQMEVRRILRGALSSLGRRLDFFEKKSRRKRRRRIRQARKDPPAFTCSSSPTSIPPLVSSSSPSPTSFSTSLSLDREDSHTLISKSEQSNSKEGEKKMGARKRRNSQVEVEEEEDAGRFVGQMAVSFTRQGGGAEALLTLHDFNHKRREQGETGQPEKDASVVVRQNGYSSTSHHPLHRLQSAQSGWTSTQSEAACRSFVQWHFSNSILSTSLFSNHRFSHRRLCCFLSFSPTSMLQLSAVSVETVSKLLKGEACESPLWPLKDWTAPPSLSSDHWLVDNTP